MQTTMKAAFSSRFGSADGLRVFRAPGRVNLIGEHTDYNLGFVLPVALDLATLVAVAPSGDGKLRIYSEHRGELREFEAAAIPSLERRGDWSDYVIGVAHELDLLGLAIEPANLLIRSTVPEGSGLSSSAALEVAAALALLGGRPLDPLEIARLAQRAESRFVGMPCGIMDQYAAVFGRAHAAVELDCRSLACRYVTLPDGVAFIAVNSMVKHALSGSAYADRVKECAVAVEALRARFPEVSSLRDATEEQLPAVSMPDAVARRARHVVSEIARVGRFVAASAAGDLADMGKLLVASHRSLQHDYEVSCAELDFLVDAALAIDGVYGARMTGGGFGGCTVTMVSQEKAEEFSRQIVAAYRARFGVPPRVLPCNPSAGAGECGEGR
ncbi:MAG: galactokinase [Bryobacteraceae bacterium]